MDCEKREKTIEEFKELGTDMSMAEVAEHNVVPKLKLLVVN